MTDKAILNGPMLNGLDLCLADRQRVLGMFPDRYTREHIPFWVFAEPEATRARFPVQFENDQEWLAGTWFYVTSRGLLDARVKQCVSEPTWPDNPELRGKPRYVEAAHGVNLRYQGWARSYRSHQAGLTIERYRADPSSVAIPERPARRPRNASFWSK